MYIMYLSVLRSKRILTLFICSSIYENVLAPLMLKDEEWQKVAEFEAVLKHMNVLAMQVQGESAAEVGLIWFRVVLCRAKLKNYLLFKVFDISQSWTPQTPMKDILTVQLTRD
jgi:hypothetical protein